MKRLRPLIGVTPWYDYDKRMTFVKFGYCEGIVKAGGIPMLLPVSTDEMLLDEILERVDGILVSGGPDVDPRYYGEHNLPCNQDISPYRDSLEIYLSRWAVEMDKPIFGICRGVQIMNVAMGGTLYQDIDAQVKEAVVLKHSQDAPRWYPTHNISIKKGSRVWGSFGKKEGARVNSFHHQAVKDVAPGFEATSTAPDGIIESIEYPGKRFAVGVQWHPELLWQEDEGYLSLFRELVESCR